MNQLLWLAARSFGLSVVLTPVIRDIFRSYNVVDRPDARKVHRHPIPRVGGIAIMIAYVVSFYLIHPQDGGIERELSLFWKLLPAASLVFAIGLIDDFFGLKPWQKLIGQFAAAGLAYWAGVRIHNIAGYATAEWWSFPITVFWLLLCTNAVNLVDGLDGLAGGVGMFASLTIFAAALLDGNEPLAYATLPLAAALFGFLCFNFNPATVFLGDCGSLTIGFLLGCFGVIWTHKSVTLLGMTAPLMALSIPLVDVALCIVRRWLRNQPIFSPDRGHIHHRLLDRGLTPRRAVLILYAGCGLAASFSLLQSYVNNAYVAVLGILLFCIVVWIGIKSLGYMEFVFAGQLLREGTLQRTINAQMQLRQLEAELASATSPGLVWTIIREASSNFGFEGVRLRVGSWFFESWPSATTIDDYWVLRVPLPEDDFIEFARRPGGEDTAIGGFAFADLIRSRLNALDHAAASTAICALPQSPGKHG